MTLQIIEAFEKHEDLQNLLENQEILDQIDEDGNSALHIAVKKGYLDLVAKLLNSKININAQNGEKETALYLAVQDNQEEIIKMLLKSNADILIAKRGGQTPIHLAAFRKFGYNQKVFDSLFNKLFKTDTINTHINMTLSFIWYGSSISEKKQKESVIAWRKKYPNIPINIWYDPKLLTQDQIKDFSKWSEENHIILLDINESINKREIPYNEHAEYESAGPYPNYAARSDYDRLTLGYYLGIIYLDTDVFPGDESLPEQFKTEYGVLFNQFFNIKNLSLETMSPTGGPLTNDIILSSKFNPILKLILDELNKMNTKNFPLAKTLDEFRLSAFTTTVDKSGPNFFRHTLCKLGLIEDPNRPYDVKLPASFQLKPNYFENEKNDASWVVSESSSSENQRFSLPKKNYHNNFENFLQDVAIKTAYEIKWYGRSLLNDYLQHSPITLPASALEEIKKLPLNELIGAEINKLNTDKTKSFSQEEMQHLQRMIKNEINKIIINKVIFDLIDKSKRTMDNFFRNKILNDKEGGVKKDLLEELKFELLFNPKNNGMTIAKIIEMWQLKIHEYQKDSKGDPKPISNKEYIGRYRGVFFNDKSKIDDLINTITRQFGNLKIEIPTLISKQEEKMLNPKSSNA